MFLAAAADIGADLSPDIAQAGQHILADAGHGAGHGDVGGLRREQAINAVIRHPYRREQQSAERRNDGNPEEQGQPLFRALFRRTTDPSLCKRKIKCVRNRWGTIAAALTTIRAKMALRAARGFSLKPFVFHMAPDQVREARVLVVIGIRLCSRAQGPTDNEPDSK